MVFPCHSKEAKLRCFFSFPFRFCFGDSLDRRQGVWAHDTLVSKSVEVETLPQRHIHLLVALWM